ncbi:MAG: hypothetical protein GY863_04590 [bacterium]|nr:hypothetical protein [bacterium]
MTLIYAISGVAVNHVRDWNPNYTIETVTTNIGSIGTNSLLTENVVTRILKRLDEKRDVTGFHQPDRKTLLIFLDGANIQINLPTGEVVTEEISTRKVFRETNFLHLNEPKKLFTWFADLYAVSLAFLAISGLFVLKGRKGIKGRGWWLTSIGIIIPLVFLVMYY